METNPPALLQTATCIIACVTLFDEQRKQRLSREAPLAARMRPRTFDELVGQEHIVGPDRVLRKSIEADQVPSMVLWGPPGSGKTTLALLIATLTRSHFAQVSAVAAGVADLRKIIQEARDPRSQEAADDSGNIAP